MKPKNCTIPILIQYISNIMVFFALIFLLNPRELLAQESSRNANVNPGAHIVIRMTTGEEVEGVLLSVRQNALVVAALEEIEDKDSSEIMKYVRLLSTNDIQKVIVQGESKVLKGMGGGLLCGFIVGGMIGLAGGDDKPGGLFSMTAGQKAMAGGMGLGVVGAVVGTVVGVASSTADKTIDPLPGRDFSVLKVLARYKDVEPLWLQLMQ